jgi:hypothetical protein
MKRLCVALALVLSLPPGAVWTVNSSPISYTVSASQDRLRGGARLRGGSRARSASGACASFPCSAVLDNFDRANEGPPPSANWTGQIPGSGGSFTVTSNRAAPTADPSSMWWNASNFANPEVYVTIVTVFAPTRIYGRIQQEGTAGFDGYAVLAYSDNNFYVYRVDDGSYTQLGAAIPQSFAVNDSIGMSVSASHVISVYYCASGGSCGVSGAGWTLKGTRTDTGCGGNPCYTGTGKIGVQIFDSTGFQLENFGGGTQ